MKKNKNIIWEDSRQKPGFCTHFLTSIPILIFAIGFIISFGSWESLGWLFLTVVFALTFSLGFRIKYLRIGVNGIWSGNNTSGQMIFKLFILKQKNTFIAWGEIDKLEIAKKEIYFSYFTHMANFIIIKIKDGTKYECVIIDITGFKDALKKLKKHNLLNKENRSKYK